MALYSSNGKKVFVSFDYDNDRHYYYLLKGWDANKSFKFHFSDYTSKEIKSDSVRVVKQKLNQKINEADYTLVIIGEHSNDKLADSALIGYRNWQNYEIAKSIEHGNKLIAVKIDRTYDSPDEILENGASWAMSFTEASITKALEDA